jgi:hypothetical protein
MTGGSDLPGFVFSEPYPDRLAALKEFARSKGKLWTSVQVQTQFVLESPGVREMILEFEREAIVESIPWAD